MQNFGKNWEHCGTDQISTQNPIYEWRNKNDKKNDLPKISDKIKHKIKGEKKKR